MERVVDSACRRFEEDFAEQVMERLGPSVCARLEDLLGRPHVLAELKSDPQVPPEYGRNGPRS
ncbi:hypothetical protein ABT294_48420 [Nonomuraea sp. NPDC000554]|uniref:hypothetical protein n=1 Tax=Nonomuraea sp. NPDC000554 TaxID=3154259 RepID=UPI00332893E0